MKHLVLITLLLTFLTGCKTNPPVSVEVVKGKIEITANIQGAKIFVNGSDSGNLTPATLELTPGKYTFKLTKDGYSDVEKEYTIVGNQTISAVFELTEISVSKIVLLEDFANVSCDPCVISNKILHSLSEKYKNRIAIVKFPVNFPSPNDPFYLHAKDYAGKRSSYYKIFSAPTVIVDGTTRPIATDSTSIINAIESNLAKTPYFNISVTKTVANSQVSVNVALDKFSDALENLENVVIHTVIIEKRIEFQSPPGSNGEKIFYDVMRKMLPDADGTPLNLVNNKQTISTSVATDPLWNKDQLQVIVYVQNKITKEIYQAAISD